MSELFESIMNGFKEIGELTGNTELAESAEFYLEHGADADEIKEDEKKNLITV